MEESIKQRNIHILKYTEDIHSGVTNEVVYLTCQDGKDVISEMRRIEELYLKDPNIENLTLSDHPLALSFRDTRTGFITRFTTGG